MRRREFLRLAGFGVAYITLFDGLALAASQKGAPEVFFALRGDGTVAVIDMGKDEVIAKIETGGKGGTLGSVTKDGRYLFVANNAPNQRTVTVIETGSLKKLKDLETGSRPKHPIVSPDNKLVAVNHSGMDEQKNRVAFISVKDLEIVKIVELPVTNTEHKGDFSMHGTFSPDGKYYFIGNYADNKFYILSAKDFSVVSTVEVKGNPHYFDVHKNKLWVTVEFDEPKSNTSQPVVYVYDITKASQPKLMRTLEVELNEEERANPAKIEGHHGNFTNDGSHFMLCNRGASPFEGTTIKVYETKSGKLEKSIRSNIKGVGHAYIAPNGKYAVITQYGDNKIEIVDLKNFESVKTIDVEIGKHMGHVVFTKDSKKFYVSNRVADSVFVIDAQRFEVMKRIMTGDSGQAQGQLVKHFYGVFERVVNPYLG